MLNPSDISIDGTLQASLPYQSNAAHDVAQSTTHLPWQSDGIMNTSSRGKISRQCCDVQLWGYLRSITPSEAIFEAPSTLTI